MSSAVGYDFLKESSAAEADCESSGHHFCGESAVFFCRCDRALRAANDAVDMNNHDLVTLVRSVVQNDGVLSINRRKLLLTKGHPAGVIDAAVAAIGASLSESE